MNRENVQAVRDLIASLPPERFSMTAYAKNPETGRTVPPYSLNRSCGTAGCIAGWAVALRRSLGLRRPRETRYSDWMATMPHGEARDWLGLSNDDAVDLFEPGGRPLTDYTQAEAVATLDHLLQVGEISWPPQEAGAQ